MGFQANFRRKELVSRAAVVVCLILVALFSVVQVTHVHQTASEADHCALCILMHSAAPIAMAVTVVVLVQLGVSAPVVQARAVVRYWHPQLFTRPPPQTW